MSRRRSPGAGGALDPRLLRRAGATRGYLIAGAVLGSVTALLIVAQAWLLATGIAGAFARRDLTAVREVAVPLVAVFALRAALRWLDAIVAARSAAAVKSQLRREIIAARLRSPSADLKPGALTSVLTQGLDALDGYFARYLPQLVLAVTVPVIVGAAIWTADWVSVVIVAATVPLIPVFMVLVGRMTQTRVRRRARLQARLADHFADLVAGLPTLQVFGRARAQAEGLRRSGEAHRSETMATLRISFLSALVLELLATLSVAMIAVGIGLRVVEGELTLFTGLFVLILAPEVYLPLRQVGVHYHDSADGVAAAEHAFALIDAAPAPAPGRTQIPDLRDATVEFDAVTVRHPGVAAPALERISLVLGAGEVVAICGPSGAGKSSLLGVLLGFVRPESGRVLVGGVPLPELDPDAWRAALAWVPQQPALIAGTIAENVLLGAPDAPQSRVRAALAGAGAGGLDPDRLLDAGGEGLSTGERRRVAIARALLRIDCGGGQLLVLDEPTAGLDVETELAAIAGLRSVGVGALVVSHREPVLAAADRVIPLAAPVPLGGPR
ncbi:thiol reductant ABC exporter subunit CydD [Microlunatus ginsengisoli]|uniref:Thiol reductant ABC exporter subunit CydD n=1 Tax=Microlunatus ginsengisoli TaxID=363863 RepID=A0ABP6ZL10_9ACTN